MEFGYCLGAAAASQPDTEPDRDVCRRTRTRRVSRVLPPLMALSRPYPSSLPCGIQVRRGARAKCQAVMKAGNSLRHI